MQSPTKTVLRILSQRSAYVCARRQLNILRHLKIMQMLNMGSAKLF